MSRFCRRVPNSCMLSGFKSVCEFRCWRLYSLVLCVSSLVCLPVRSHTHQLPLAGGGVDVAYVVRRRHVGPRPLADPLRTDKNTVSINLVGGKTHKPVHQLFIFPIVVCLFPSLTQPESRVPGSTLLNLAASHDGIGLTWCRGVLKPAEIDHLTRQVVARGGNAQYA